MATSINYPVGVFVRRINRTHLVFLHASLDEWPDSTELNLGGISFTAIYGLKGHNIYSPGPRPGWTVQATVVPQGQKYHTFAPSGR